MNTTPHKLSVIIQKEDFDELERRANRTKEEVQEDAKKLLKAVVHHLRKMSKPMDPHSLADFIEMRMEREIEALV